jgi:hypothetical protein
MAMAPPTKSDVAEELSIESALSLITDANHQKYLRATCRHVRINEQRTLADMIETIVNDPREWFHAFPKELKAASALAKPKTAVLTLLRHDTVRRVYGDEYCDRNLMAIDTAWKKHKNEVIASRADNRSSPSHHEAANTGAAGTAVGGSQSPHNNDQPTIDEAQPPHHTTPEMTTTATATSPDTTTPVLRVLKIEKEAKNSYLQRAQQLESQVATMHATLKRQQETITELKDIIMRLAKRAYTSDDDVAIYAAFLKRF